MSVLIAVDITSVYSGSLRAPEPDMVLECASRPWPVSENLLRQHSTELVAVAQGTIVGAFLVHNWSRGGDGVEFDLAPTAEWQHLIGTPCPPVRFTAKRPVRPVGGMFIDMLKRQHPATPLTAQGWSLEVAPDGRTATVNGPGDLTLVQMSGPQATLAVQATAESGATA